MENLPCGFGGVNNRSDDEFRNHCCFKWSLRIQGTPASWYMSTLLHGALYPRGITIDYGQNWYCTNFQEVLNEAQKLI